jgi:hypothetical protein
VVAYRTQQGTRARSREPARGRTEFPRDYLKYIVRYS